MANMRRPSPAGLPVCFLPWELARRGEVLAGEFSVSDLGRSGVAGEGQLSAEIRGEMDVDGAAWLRVRVRGEVDATCQRCLDPVTVMIDQSTDLRIAFRGGQLASTTPEEEVLLDDTESPLETLDLIEDEVILALPIAPRHAPGACSPDGGTKVGKVEVGPAVDQERQDHPFALLRSLKKE